ncbi:MAG: hypothetical protein C0P72_004850 [Clostridia bacterium]
MISHNLAIIHIDVGQDKEESVLASDISVLHINLPQYTMLVWRRNGAVLGQFPGMFPADFPLWAQNIQFFAQTVHLLLVDHEPIVLSEHVSQLPVTVCISIPGDGLHKPLFHLLIATLRLSLVSEYPGMGRPPAVVCGLGSWVSW